MSVTSELKAYQEARRVARSKPLQENLQEAAPGTPHSDTYEAGKLAPVAARIAHVAGLLPRQRARISASFHFIGVLQECQAMADLIYGPIAGTTLRGEEVRKLLEQTILKIEHINNEVHKYPLWTALTDR